MPPPPLPTSGRHPTRQSTKIFAPICAGLLLALALHPTVAESQATVANGGKYYFIKGSPLDTVNQRLSFPTPPPATYKVTVLPQPIPGTIYNHSLTRTRYVGVLESRQLERYDGANNATEKYPPRGLNIPPNTEILYQRQNPAVQYFSRLNYTVSGGLGHISGNASGVAGAYSLRYYVQPQTITCPTFGPTSTVCINPGPPLVGPSQGLIEFKLIVLNPQNLTASYQSDGHTTLYSSLSTEPLHKGDEAYLKITGASIVSGTMYGMPITHAVTTSCRTSLGSRAPACPSSHLKTQDQNTAVFGEGSTLPTDLSLDYISQGGTPELRLSGSVTHPGAYSIAYQPGYKTPFQGTTSTQVLNNRSPYIRLTVAQNSVPGLTGDLPATFGQYLTPTTHSFPAVTGGNGTLIERLAGTFTPTSGGTAKPAATDPNTGKLLYTEGSQSIDTGLTFAAGATEGGIPRIHGSADTLPGTYALTYTLADSDRITGSADEYSKAFVLTVHNHTLAPGNATAPDLGTLVLVKDLPLTANLTLTRITAPANTDPRETLTFNSFHTPGGTARTPSIAADNSLRVNGTSTGLQYVQGTSGTTGHITGTPQMAGTYSLTQSLQPVAGVVANHDITLKVVTNQTVLFAPAEQQRLNEDIVAVALRPLSSNTPAYTYNASNFNSNYLGTQKAMGGNGTVSYRISSCRYASKASFNPSDPSDNCSTAADEVHTPIAGQQVPYPMNAHTTSSNLFLNGDVQHFGYYRIAFTAVEEAIPNYTAVQSADEPTSDTVVAFFDLIPNAVPSMDTSALNLAYNRGSTYSLELPQISGGNLQLGDLLRSQYDADGDGGAAPVSLTTLTTSGPIRLPNNSLSGLTFTSFADSSNGRASISGTPLRVGLFNLLYEAIDIDNVGSGHCTGTDSVTGYPVPQGCDAVQKPLNITVQTHPGPQMLTPSPPVDGQTFKLASNTALGGNLTMPLGTGGQGTLTTTLTGTYDDGVSAATTIKAQSTTGAILLADDTDTGLRFNPQPHSATAGHISGKPTAEGIYVLTYTVTDSRATLVCTPINPPVNCNTDAISFTLNVVPAAPVLDIQMPAASILLRDTDTTIRLPKVSSGNIGTLSYALSGTFTNLDNEETTLSLGSGSTSAPISVGSDASGLSLTRHKAVGNVNGTITGKPLPAGTRLPLGTLSLVYTITDDIPMPSGDKVTTVPFDLHIVEADTLLIEQTLAGQTFSYLAGAPVGASTSAPFELALPTQNAGTPPYSASIATTCAPASGTGSCPAGAVTGAAAGAPGSLPLGLTFTAQAPPERSYLSGNLLQRGVLYSLSFSVTDSPVDNSFQTADTGDTRTIAFSFAIDSNALPTLTEGTPVIDAATFLYEQNLPITKLPVTGLHMPTAGGGNGTLTDSLSGQYDPDGSGGTAAAALVLAPSTGAILLPDGSTPSGLSFTPRTSGTRASISGTPLATGSYALRYAVTDSDANTTVCTSTGMPAGCDTAAVTFTIDAQQHLAPTLASGGVQGQTYQLTRAVELAPNLTLPAASGGNGAISDALSGSHDPDGDGPMSATPIQVQSGTGKILLSDTDTDTGLSFTPGGNAAAFIAGTPSANGTYSLTYSLTDSDLNNLIPCAGASPPSNCDTAAATFTLVVADRRLMAVGTPSDLTLTDTPITAPITLPTASGALGPVTYALTGTFTAAGSSTPTAIAISSGNLLQQSGGTDTGLDFTAHSSNSNGPDTAASISGTPTQAGLLSLTYSITDDAPLHKTDLVVSSSFDLRLVPDLAPQLTAGTLDGAELLYLTGDSLGTSSTPLALPTIASSGNAPLSAETLTSCHATSRATLSSCDAASVNIQTSGANSLPKNLAFAPAAGDTAAGLTGAVATAGYYRLTYSISDTPIANASTQQAQDTADSDSITFYLDVQDDIAPTLDALASTSFTGDKDRAITAITLPTAGGGNGPLTDSLSGSFAGDDNSLDGSISVAADNRIILANAAPSGLIFTPRTRGASGTAASISGRPAHPGTFTFTYSVGDSDSNSSGQGGDLASATLTLAITAAALQLDGGVAHGATVDLAKDSPLTAGITLPQVTAGASAAANLSRTLTVQQTADSDGAIASPQAPATVASAAEAIPGLTYTALSTSGATTTPGTLAGTPDTLGIWLLAYSIVDNNGTTGAGNALDDSSAGISFSLHVFDNGAPSLQTFNSYSFSYTVADPVGADADTPFDLPAISSGHGAVGDSISTSCAPTSGSGTCADADTSGTAGQPGSLPAGLTFTAAGAAAGASAGTAAKLSGAFSSYGVTYTLIYSVTDTPQTLTYQAADTANTVTATFTFVVAQGNNTPTFSAQTPASPKLLEKLPGDNADSTPNTLDDPRLLATLTFADADAADTLSYSIAGVTPATLSTGDFSVAAKTGNPRQAELSFIGDASAIDHDDVQSFTVTVRADDSGVGGQIDQPVEVTVLDNTAPTASVAATGTPSLLPGSPLTLTASASDANTGAGDTLSYAWTVAAATPATGVTGATAAIGDLSLTPTDDQTGVSLNVPVKPSGTTYTIQVAVTDRASQTATATYSLVVANAPIAFSYSPSPSGTPPTYSVANGIVATSGDDSDLIATITASDPNDPSGASLQYSGTVSVSGTDTVLGLSSRNSTDISAIFGFAASGADLGKLSVISSTPLTAAATYQLRLTVAKTKGDGTKETATADFDVQVLAPNAATLTTTIAAISMPRSTPSTPSTRTIDLYDHFSPAAGLTFKATSSNTKVLTLSESGGVLTLTAAQAGGTSSVEVSASNTSTATTTFSVTVTPTNNPTLAAAQVTNIETSSKGMTAGQDATLALNDYFSDPDSDTLSYELLDADGNPQSAITHRQTIGGTATDVLTLTLSGATLTLSPLAETNADLSIRVRATDSGGNTFIGTFVATVTNTAPTVSVAATGTPSLLPGSPLTLTASASDANTGAGDTLSYAWTVTAATPATGVTGATAAIGDLSLTPTDDQTGVSLNVPVKPSGTTYTIQVAVTDRASQTATATYSLVVANAPIAFSYNPSPSGTPPTYSVANGIVATSGDDSDLIATITASDPNDPSGTSLQYSGTVSVSGTDTVLGLSSRNSTDISAIFGFAASGADLGELSVISSTPLTAAATYQLRLTVAKTKGDGTKEAATADFDVQVLAPNAATLTTAIAAISMPRSTPSTPSTRTIDLYDHFSPAAGLTFKATSSNTKVLTLSESGGVLTLTAAQAGGTSSVEVSASNTSTATTTFSVTVTPTNNPTLAAAQVTNIETSSKGMTAGQDATLALNDYFSDPDSDTLSYELLDADGNPQSAITHRQTIGGTATDVLTITLSGATLTLSPLAETNAELSIRVRATDSGGNTFIGTFVATVTHTPANTAPTATATIAPQIAVIGETTTLATLTLADYFADAETPDADLIFSASSDKPAAVSAATVDATSKALSLTVPASASHGDTATITITATDASAATATQSFTATAVSRPAFSTATYSADLAENTDGSGTAVALAELRVSGGTGAKTYRLLSVDGQTGGTDYGKFAVAAKLDASDNPIDTAAVVTYSGTGEDYAALKALSAPSEPTFVLVIGVTDSNDLAAPVDTTLTLTLTAVSTLSPPMADAGGDLNVLPGQQVTLDGGASSAPNGEQLTYRWTQQSGPAVTLSGADTPNPSFTTPQEAGDLVFALVVRDGALTSAPDSVRVRVLPLHGEVLGRYLLAQVDTINNVLGERTTQLASGAQHQTDFSFSDNHSNNNFNNSGGDARLDRFVLPLARARGYNSSDSSGSSSSTYKRGLTVWGAARHDTLSESGGRIDSLSGADTNLHLGIDLPLADNILGGMLITSASGELDFKIGSSNNAYQSNLSQFTPYVAYSTDGLNLWGGAGWGNLLIDSDAESIKGVEASTTSSMLNLRARLIDSATQLHLRLASTSAQLSIARSQLGPLASGAGQGDYSVEAARTRLGLELSSTLALANGSRLLPSLQLASIDETMSAPLTGDLDTGGSEIGFGLRYILPAPSWTVAFGGRVRTLDDGREEDGIYLLLQLDPRNDSRGLELSLKPVWGRMDSTLEQLWQGIPISSSGIDSGSGIDSSSAAEQHLNMSLGYGLELPGGRNLLHPFSTLSLAPDGDRRLEAGLRWQPTPALQLSLSSTLSRDNRGHRQQDGTELSANLKF